MKKLFLFFLVLLLILMSCSIEEPASPGTSTAEPVYTEQTGAGTSIAEPLFEYSNIGSSPLVPLYIVSSNTTANWIHAGQHEDGGFDEISLTGLSGTLADDQHVLDSEVISAIENASPLTLPAYTLTGNITSASYGIETGTNSLHITTDEWNEGIKVTCLHSHTSGVRFITEHWSATPANNDIICSTENWGRDSLNNDQRYGIVNVRLNEVSSGSEDSKIQWYLMDNGSTNQAMELSGNGTLSVDDSYSTFDYLDDAIVLKKGISQGDKDLMVNVGVLSPKRDIDNKIIIGEYTINLQAIIKLIAGGVYQNRDYIESLESRIEYLESKIK